MSPITIIVSGYEASALGHSQSSPNVAENIRRIAKALIAEGRDPNLPVRIALRGGCFVASIPTLADAIKPQTFSRDLIRKIAPNERATEPAPSRDPVPTAPADPFAIRKPRRTRGCRGGVRNRRIAALPRTCTTRSASSRH